MSDQTEDVLPLLHVPWHGRPLIRLTILVLLFQLLAARVSYLIAPTAVASEPTFEEIFARSRTRPRLLSQTVEQADNAARLEGLVAAKTSAFAGRTNETIVPVTAVLLSWKRHRGLDLVLRYVAKHPFVREIIVWNNNVDVFVDRDDIAARLGAAAPEIRVVNSPNNLHDLGKHYACALATNEQCYFNDDDWLNVRLDAQYVKYIDDGARRIVSTTLPYIAWESRRWRFANPAVELHTGFTWIGAGAFAPRDFSQRFLSQLGTPAASISAERMLTADMFFSLWTNAYPEQMPTELVPIDVEGSDVAWKASVPDQWAVFFPAILDAVRLLFDIISVKDPFLSPDPFPIAPVAPAHDAHAACANDRCLFLTNLSPFPSPADLSFPAPIPPKRSIRDTFRWRSRRHAHQPPAGFNPHAIQHIREHEARFDALADAARGLNRFPPVEWFVERGSWHLAVDGVPEHCWDSWFPPAAGDYFGLHLVTPRTVGRIEVVGSADLAQLVSADQGIGATGSTAGAWEIWTLDRNATDWEQRSISSSTSSRTDDGFERVVVELVPTASAAPISKLRFVSSDAKRQPVRVCGFTIDDDLTI